MAMPRFFAELRRRNVFRVAGVYLVVAWLVTQVVAAVAPMLGLPVWFGKGVLLLLAVGFPIALVLAWAFEMTPEGVKLTKNVPEGESIAAGTGRTLDYAIIAGLALVAVLIVADRLMPSFRIDEAAQVDGAEDAAPAATRTAAPSAEAASVGPSEKSVAVLPFIALSSGEDDGYFADGLTEEILNTLASLPDLLVTARTSSFYFKGKNIPVDEIAERLSVAHVVEGTVRRAGDKVRVTAQLIRASDGFHLWSDTYDAGVDNVFAVQTDIAEKVADALDIYLDAARRRQLQIAGVRDVDAFIAYQKGYEIFRAAHEENDTEAMLAKANRYFDDAIALAPNFALAYFLRSDLPGHYLVYPGTIEETEYGAPSPDAYAGIHARQTQDLKAALAATTDPGLTLLLRSDLAIFFDDWTPMPALIDELTRSETCARPNWIQNFLFIEAPANPTIVEYFERRIQCDPLRGEDWGLAAFARLNAGDPDTALALIERGLAVSTTSIERLRVWKVSVLYALGRFDEALAYSRLLKRGELRTIDIMDYQYYAAKGDAVALARLMAERKEPGEDATVSITLAAWAGDRDGANAAAARLDAHPFGQVALMEIPRACLCGAPFDLEATPNFAARLEEAGLAWPPASPIDWPLKDW